MAKSQQQQHDSPLVAAYLTELDHALAASDPQERAEIVSAVREHISDAIGSSLDPDQISQVLAELGPVDRIAASATQPAASAPAAPAEVSWKTMGILIVAVGSLLLVFFNPVVAVPLAVVSLILATNRLSQRHGKERSMTWTAIVASTTALITAAILALVLVSASGTLTRGETYPVEPLPGQVE